MTPVREISWNTVEEIPFCVCNFAPSSSCAFRRVGKVRGALVIITNLKVSQERWKASLKRKSYCNVLCKKLGCILEGKSKLVM